MVRKQLFSAATTTANSTQYNWPGGPGLFSANDLGTGSVQLEYSPDGTNFHIATIPGSTGSVVLSTGDGSLPFSLPACLVRAVQTTASSTGTNAWVVG